MQHTHYIIDGYSLLHRKHPGQLGNKTELDRRREELIQEVDQWMPSGDRVTLVFDGRTFSRAAQSRSGQFHIVYTSKNQSADAYIERLCQDAAKPESLTVISNDRAILELGASVGCHTRSCAMYMDELASQVHRRTRTTKQINLKARGPRLGDFFPE